MAAGPNPEDISNNLPEDPAFSTLDAEYLQRLHTIDVSFKEKVINFDITEVLQLLKKCTNDQEGINTVMQVLDKVNRKRSEWENHMFDTHEKQPGSGETKKHKLSSEELKHCLMVFTYTDDELFQIVSVLLNHPSKRKLKAKQAEVEAAQFWISCIRESLTCLSKSFPEWVHSEKKWRGMTFQYDNLTELFKIGSQKAWYTMKSTTYKADVMQEDDFCGQTGPRTIFEILDCPALDISQISEYREECECLVLPGTFFTVENRMPGPMQNGDPFQNADKIVLRFLGNDIPKCLVALQYKHQNHIVVIGNPGCGKSTLLNRYAGAELFRAGWSVATGLTQELETSEFTDVHGRKGLLMDTPGLADINDDRKESAAAAIFNALMMVPSFRVFFVVTLEAGRIRPQDLETIRLVLMACGDMEDHFHYGVIINQYKPPPKHDNQIAKEIIQDTFRQYFDEHLELEKKGQGFFHFAPDETALLEKDVCAPLGRETLQFMSGLPVTDCQQKMKKVNIHAYKQLVEEVKKLQDRVTTEVRRKNRNWQFGRSLLCVVAVLLLAIICGAIHQRQCSYNHQQDREQLDLKISQLDIAKQAHSLSVQSHKLHELKLSQMITDRENEGRRMAVELEKLTEDKRRYNELEKVKQRNELRLSQQLSDQLHKVQHLEDEVKRTKKQLDEKESRGLLSFLFG